MRHFCALGQKPHSLVGSNADEAAVFGHNDIKTVGDYKGHLQRDTGQYWKEEFQLYRVNSDADVPTRSVQLESDEFACGAYSIAQAMTKYGIKQAAGYARIVPSPTTTASPPT